MHACVHCCWCLPLQQLLRVSTTAAGLPSPGIPCSTVVGPMLLVQCRVYTGGGSGIIYDHLQMSLLCYLGQVWRAHSSCRAGVCRHVRCCIIFSDCVGLLAVLPKLPIVAPLYLCCVVHTVAFSFVWRLRQLLAINVRAHLRQTWPNIPKCSRAADFQQPLHQPSSSLRTGLSLVGKLELHLQAGIAQSLQSADPGMPLSGDKYSKKELSYRKYRQGESAHSCGRKAMVVWQSAANTDLITMQGATLHDAAAEQALLAQVAANAVHWPWLQPGYAQTRR